MCQLYLNKAGGKNIMNSPFKESSSPSCGVSFTMNFLKIICEEILISIPWQLKSVL